MRLKNRAFETFNDGALTVCTTSERSIIGVRQESLRFGDKTVGVNRFFQAQIASSQIDRLVAVPWADVRQNDLIVIGGVQYRIVKIQDKFDAMPPCRYLSLEESKVRYKDGRN